MKRLDPAQHLPSRSCDHAFEIRGVGAGKIRIRRGLRILECSASVHALEAAEAAEERESARSHTQGSPWSRCAMLSAEREHQLIISVRGRKDQGSRIRAAAGVRVDRRKIQRSLVPGGEVAAKGADADLVHANRIDAQERRAAEVSRVGGVYLELELELVRTSLTDCLGILNRHEERQGRRTSDQGSEDEAIGIGQAWQPG